MESLLFVGNIVAAGFRSFTGTKLARNMFRNLPTMYHDATFPICIYVTRGVRVGSSALTASHRLREKRTRGVEAAMQVNRVNGIDGTVVVPF